MNHTSTKRSSRAGTFVLWGASIVWIVVFVSDAAPTVVEHSDYYQFAVSATPKEIRDRQVALGAGSLEFATILDECDRIVPPDAKVQIVLPKATRINQEYFVSKSRYVLYPKNNGNNDERQPFILVYGVPQFKVPDGYRLIKAYGKGRAIYYNRTMRKPGSK